MGVLKSVGFEPYMLLVRACCKSNSLTEQEEQAYELACNQFGENNVSLQPDTDNVYGGSPSYRIRHGDVEYFLEANPLNSCNIQDIKPLNIEEIQKIFGFQNFASNYSIYIHWPEVTITNEDDQSTQIKDFFCRVPLYTNGLSFREEEYITFMRSTFTRSHWNNGYTHSHMDGLYRRSPLRFQHYCLGSGPIKNTIRHLQQEPSNQEATMLFFWELDKLVHVESLAGVPYRRLMDNNDMQLTPCDGMDMGSSSTIEQACNNGLWIRDFLISFIKSEKIPLAFHNGYYQLGCSFKDFAILLTNYYLKWWDAAEVMTRNNMNIPIYIRANLFYKEGYMREYYISNNKICVAAGRATDASVPTNIRPFVFGNTSFPLVVEEDGTNRDYSIHELLTIEFVSSALSFILTSINSLSSQNEQETQTNQVSQCSPFVCQGNETRGHKGHAGKDATPIN